MKQRSFATAVGAGMLAHQLGALALAAATLQPIPQVNLSGMEPAVRQQVETAQQMATAAASEPTAQAAEHFGAAGKVFLIYLLRDTARSCFENAAALAPKDARWVYLAGVAAEIQTDVEPAERHFEQALALRPDLLAAEVRLGDVELLRGLPDAAQKAFNAALASPGTAAAAHFGLGRVALQRGDLRAAATHLEAALAADPAASAVHALLATAYRRLGDGTRADAEAAAYGNRPVRFADPLMEEAAAANTGRLIRVQGALAAFNSGRFAEAETGFRQAIELDPTDALAWLNLATAQERQGKAAEAIGNYRRALELDPENARAHYDLGTLLASQGQRAAGITELAAAVRLRPGNLDARFNLATALAQENRFAEAVQQCEAILQINPQDQQARGLRDELKARLGSNSDKPPR